MLDQKLPEENTGSKVINIIHSNMLLNISPYARETKEKINKWNYKLKSFCTVKKTINKMKRKPTEWEKIFANDIIQ